MNVKIFHQKLGNGIDGGITSIENKIADFIKDKNVEYMCQSSDNNMLIVTVVVSG